MPRLIAVNSGHYRTSACDALLTRLRTHVCSGIIAWYISGYLPDTGFIVYDDNNDSDRSGRTVITVRDETTVFGDRVFEKKKKKTND